MSTPSKLWAWRVNNDLSQQDMADLTGLSPAMISLVERGKRNLRPTTKAKVARRLGVPIAILFDVEPFDEPVAS